MSLSFSGSGSLYNQALQVHKTVKLGGYKVDKEKTTNFLAYTQSYKDGEIDPEPPKPEKHKINLIA